MSFSLETEYVSTNKLNLVKCKFCNRKFFTDSYEKHISSCEREWIRTNCREEHKSSKESGPYVKAHVTGYEVQIKTFSDMLSLGAERRRRWRLRHHEFIRTIKAAKTNCHIDDGDKSDLFYELNSKFIHAGLTQCEYCKRRFNDAAYFKHVVQCKEKQTDAKMQPTEEQKEAKERFMRRMKYNTKLVSKDQSEKALFYPGEQSINQGDTSGANETYYNQQQCELIDKLADKLCSELKLSQTPITEILQTDMLNKIIKNNITLTANEPSQITASLSCCSKSNSTASSAVVLSDNSSSHEKFKPPNPTFNKPSNVQFTRDEYGIGFLHCGGSLHYPRSNLKSSPKTIDNNLINDIDNDNNCKLDQDNVISTICQNKVKPEVKITIEETEQSKNQHHKLHKNSIRHKISRKFADANEDSNIVNYNCNGSTSKLSPERINLHQRYQLEMNIPSKQQAAGERNLLDSSSLKLVPHDEDCQKTGRINCQSLNVPKGQQLNVSFLSSLRSPGVHSSSNSNTLKESQSRNSETTSHHSNHRHHRHLDRPENSSNTPSFNQDHSSQIGSRIANSEGSSGKSKSRYCPQCGGKFASDARFCSSCGAIRKSMVSGGKDSMATSVSQQMSKLA